MQIRTSRLQVFCNRHNLMRIHNGLPVFPCPNIMWTKAVTNLAIKSPCMPQWLRRQVCYHGKDSLFGWAVRYLSANMSFHAMSPHFAICSHEQSSSLDEHECWSLIHRRQTWMFSVFGQASWRGHTSGEKLNPLKVVVEFTFSAFFFFFNSFYSSLLQQIRWASDNW